MWRQASIVALLLGAATHVFAQAKKEDKSSPRPAPPPSPRPPSPQTARPPVVLLPSGKPVTPGPSARTVGNANVQIQVASYGARTMSPLTPMRPPSSLTTSFFAPQLIPYYPYYQNYPYSQNYHSGGYYPFPFNGYAGYSNYSNFNGWSDYGYTGSYGSRDTFFGAINSYPASGSSSSLFPMSFSSWATQLFGSSYAGEVGTETENTAPDRTLNSRALTATILDLKVDLLQGDRLRLVWRGEAAPVRSVEFQELNRTDEVLTSRIVYRTPFEVVVPMPSELATVVVKVNFHLDATQTTRLPLATIMTRLHAR